MTPVNEGIVNCLRVCCTATRKLPAKIKSCPGKMILPKYVAQSRISSGKSAAEVKRLISYFIQMKDGMIKARKRMPIVFSTLLKNFQAPSSSSFVL